MEGPGVFMRLEMDAIISRIHSVFLSNETAISKQDFNCNLCAWNVLHAASGILWTELDLAEVRLISCDQCVKDSGCLLYQLSLTGAYISPKILSYNQTAYSIFVFTLTGAKFKKISK